KGPPTSKQVRGMLREALREISIFRSCYKKDQQAAEKIRRQRCPLCGGPLHSAYYLRKPRGSPVEIPAEYRVRMSLCCSRDGCRHRVLPPSCLFMGRKVHWRIVILVVMAIRQRQSPRTTVEGIEELCEVPVRTVVRWSAFFRDEFPDSQAWKRLRGRVSAVVSSAALPGALVESFLARHTEVAQALVDCLAFLAMGEQAQEIHEK
ncbi:hypothetical protein ACFL51_02090, partial [Myxococcota bacterium]